MRFSFNLSDDFVDQYNTKELPFGFGILGELTFYRTYSRRPGMNNREDGRPESWVDVCERVINGMYSVQRDHIIGMGSKRTWNEEKSQRSAQEAFDRLFHLKWSPPGRGLWMLGSGFVHERGVVEGLSNCFSGDTRFITRKHGICQFQEFNDEEEIEVWDGDIWRDATVHCFGEQNVQDIMFAPASPNPRGDGHKKSRSNLRVIVRATPDHRWILTNGDETTSLSVDDIVPGSFVIQERGESYVDGFVHGVIFGDGSTNYEYINGERRYNVRACSERVEKALSEISYKFDKIYYEKEYNDGDNLYTLRTHIDLKDFPSTNQIDYLSGFMNGWIITDASDLDGYSVKLASTNTKALEWVKDHAALCGYSLSGYSYDDRDTNYGVRNNPVCRMSLRQHESFWKVESISQLKEQEKVYCVTVPDTARFTLASGIVSGNCAFISTKNIANEGGDVFRWFMNMLMLGVGVGFDTKGSGEVYVIGPDPDADRKKIQIPDTREGWANAINYLVDAYVFGTPNVDFDFSLLRTKGEPIKGFGGVSSGPDPLKELLADARKVLERNKGSEITTRTIVDLMNMIGRAVVSGNVRRSAEIALGDPDDKEFLNLKNYDMYPERMEYGWSSNNSLYVTPDRNDYSEFAERIINNGEPGFLWIDNIHNYARMNRVPDNRDKGEGVNPCQPLFAPIIIEGRGLSTFEELSVGDRVWSKEGWTNVTDITDSGTKPVYKYVTSGGSFLGTKDHRVVTQGPPVEKVEVDSVGNIEVIHGNSERELEENRSAEIDGLAWASGNYQYGTGIDDMIFVVMEPEESDIFYSNAYSTAQPVHYKYVSPDGERIELVRVYLDTSIGYSYFLTDRTKSFPKLYYENDESYRTSFIKGLFSSHRGAIIPVDKRPLIMYVSSSKEFAEELQLQLSYFGVRSMISIIDEKSIELYVTEDFEEFYSNIGFMTEENTTTLEEIIRSRKGIDHTNRYAAVQTREYLGEYPVVDITVDNESHTYWTSGLNVSNCGEQPLENREMCQLVELYPTRHDDMYDFLRSIKFAYLYGKSVALMNDQIQDEISREVMMRNRRIGLSMTGIAQFAHEHGIPTLIDWSSRGYDEVQRYDRVYSEWFNINQSIRTTTVKPSGSVSLLSGVTPGVHYPEARCYVRRIRLADTSPLLDSLRKANYNVEKDVSSPNTWVAEIPVKLDQDIRVISEVSMWEQLELAAIMQEYWSDNSVSCTVKFDPKTTTIEEINYALQMYSKRLKAISFLPAVEHGAYAQMPYEAITEEQYEEMCAQLKPFNVNVGQEDKMMDLYCEGEACEIDFTKLKK